jgi:hypothetical protein
MVLCDCMRFCNGGAEVSAKEYREHRPARLERAGSFAGFATANTDTISVPLDPLTRKRSKHTLRPSADSIMAGAPASKRLRSATGAEATEEIDAGLSAAEQHALSTEVRFCVNLLHKWLKIKQEQNALDSGASGSRATPPMPSEHSPGVRVSPPLDLGSERAPTPHPFSPQMFLDPENDESLPFAAPRRDSSSPTPDQELEDAEGPGASEDAADGSGAPESDASRRSFIDVEEEDCEGPGADDPCVEDVPDEDICIEDIKLAMDYIRRLEDASLPGDKLPDRVRELLDEPPRPLELTPGEHLSLDFFISTIRAGEDTYMEVCGAHMRAHPTARLLSYDAARALLERVTGIVAVEDDMCDDSCIAFTGKYEDLVACPSCGKPRYEMRGRKRFGRKQMVWFPVGPQLRAIKCSREGSESMKYRERCTRALFSGDDPDTISDFFQSDEYRKHLDNIGPHDMVLVFSIDGAQLYRYKKSDCWFWVWIVLDIGPDKRYRKKYVLPAGMAPGPEKPGNIDTFLFRTLYHLCALMKDGLKVWDPDTLAMHLSRPFLALATADGPGLALLNGLAGHQGSHGCRLFCGCPGRRKPGGKKYYPALTKPLDAGYDQAVPGCAHDDIDPLSLHAGSEERYTLALNLLKRATSLEDYKAIRLRTGISKPSIFLGLPKGRSLGVPRMFPLDLMHLAALNLPQLWAAILRGTIPCSSTDNINSWDFAIFRTPHAWQEHGQLVADTKTHLPGSMHRPPRNIADYLTSGFKAGEFNQWVWNLNPALLLNRLPEPYYSNYCKAVHAIRNFHEVSSDAARRRQASALAYEFELEFEDIYYQQRADRLHFVRPCIHTLIHCGPEIEAVGPLPCYAQWTLERTIGILGQELKQHTLPYANLAQRMLLLAQLNALCVLVPDLDPETRKAKAPRGSEDIGNGFLLLRKKDRYPQRPAPSESAAIVAALEQLHPGWGTNWVEGPSAGRLRRWARIRLPNGQVGRSLWKESTMRSSIRIARNIKVSSTRKQRVSEAKDIEI